MTGREPTMPGRYIWLQTDSQSRWLWKDFAHYLAKRTGLRPVLLVTTAQDKKYYESVFGTPLDAEVVVTADYYAHVVEELKGEPSGPDIFEEAHRLERKYGVNFARSFILADRHLGRGYILGGKGNPTSRISSLGTHEMGLEASVYTLRYYEQLAERYPPALIVCNFGGGGIAGKPQVLIAQDRGIPFRAMVPGRVGGWMYWATDEMETSLALERVFKELPAPTDDEIAHVRETLTPNTMAGPEAVARLHKSLEWPTIAYRTLYKIAERAYGRLRGYRFARVGYHLSSVIVSLVRARLHWNKLRKLADPDLSAVGSRKIVYFPLQQEPESSTLVRAPYHTNQLGVLLEIALSLPADAVLAVKEHPWQLGRRPAGFYESVLAMPNVILVHPNFPSLEIVRRSAVVCSLTGSAVHEAAILGVPAVSFHTHNPVRILDHVHVLKSLKHLEVIQRILDEETPEKAATRRADGARYMMALDDYCMSFGTQNIVHRKSAPTEEELSMLAEPLLSTFSGDLSLNCRERDPESTELRQAVLS